jgi:hypothetical protein
MIQADIRGKLNANSSSRSEDVLTSNVLGLLRYVPQRLREFLVRARRVTLVAGDVVVDGPGTGLAVGSDLDVLFWQRLGRHGEIDAVIVEGPQDKPTRVVGFEAKYESGKSDAQRTGSSDEASDQLDEYWRGLSEHAFSGPATIGKPAPRLEAVQLVYVTAHLCAPLEDLRASLMRLAEHGHQVEIAWLSWRDLFHVVEAGFGPGAERRILADLKALLERKGLLPFMGVLNLRPPLVPSRVDFYRPAHWARPPAALPSPLFWRSKT